MPDHVVQFQHLVEELPSVFFVYDLASQRITYVNPAYERMWNGHREAVNEELPGLLARLHPDDRDYAVDCFARLSQGLLRENIELRLLGPNEEVQWLCVRATCRSAGGPPSISGFIDDITVDKAYKQNAEKFNTKKNSTLEILSHDLAGPLRLMQSLTGQLHQHLQAHQDPHLHELLRIITVTCGESVDMIHDFVDNEFFESSNVELKRERINLVERVEIMVDNYQRTELTLGLTFSLEAAAAIYASIDENKFMQVLNNLVGNAIKFTPAGGHIRVALSETPDQVLITVADDGIGIPADVQAELFERFTRARRPGLRGEKSTGLGMSIVRTIVLLHEGCIWFESQEGEGTTFYIELPKGI